MILNYIHWNPDPEIINFFGFSIRYYGVLFGSGLLLSAFVLRKIFDREGLPLEDLQKLCTYGMIGIVAGARLGHCLFYDPSYYLSHPLEMILPISFTADGGIEVIGYQGLASHGGVLGLLIASYLYCRKTNHSMIDTFDLIAVASGLSFGFIRLANFMNSEIIGIPTTKPWGVIFERLDDIPRHPAQVYEAIAYFLIFILMLVLYTRTKISSKRGALFGLATVLFFTARILIEFVKENQMSFEEELVFNMGQLLSLPYILVGIGFIIYSVRKRL